MSQKNPIDFVKHRALWLGGLAAVSAAVVGGIAYMAARSTGTTTPNATTPAPSDTSSSGGATTAPTTATTAPTTGSTLHTVPVTNGTQTGVNVNPGDTINITTPSLATGATVSQGGGTGTGGTILLNGQMMGSYGIGSNVQLTVNWTLSGAAQTATITVNVNQSGS
jgi:hypothetical protein